MDPVELEKSEVVDNKRKASGQTEYADERPVKKCRVLEDKYKLVTSFDEALKDYFKKFESEAAGVDFLAEQAKASCSEFLREFLSCATEYRPLKMESEPKWMNLESSKVILGAVSRHLDVQTLKNLRLVCKWWCEAVTPIVDTVTVLTGRHRGWDWDPYDTSPLLRGYNFYGTKTEAEEEFSWIWRTHRFRHVEVIIDSEYVWDLNHIKSLIKWLFQSPTMEALESLRIVGFRPDVFNRDILPYFIPKYLKNLKALTLLKPLKFERRLKYNTLGTPVGDLKLEKLVVQLGADWDFNWEFLNRCPNSKTFKLIALQLFAPEPEPLDWMIEAGDPESAPPSPEQFHDCLKQALKYLTSKEFQKLGLKFGNEYDVNLICDFISKVSADGHLKDLSLKVDLEPSKLKLLVNKLPPATVRSAKLLIKGHQEIETSSDDLFKILLETLKAKGYLNIPRFQFTPSMLKHDDVLVLRLWSSTDAFELPPFHQTVLPKLFPNMNYACIPVQYRTIRGTARTRTLEGLFSTAEKAFSLESIRGTNLETFFDGISPLERSIIFGDLNEHCASIQSDTQALHDNAVHVPKELTYRELSFEKYAVFIFGAIDPADFERRRSTYHEHYVNDGVKTMVRTFSGAQVSTHTIPKEFDDSAKLEALSNIYSAFNQYLQPLGTAQEAWDFLFGITGSTWLQVTSFMHLAPTADISEKEDWRKNAVVLKAIFELLDLANLKKVRRVCKEWESVACSILVQKVVLTSRRHKYHEPYWKRNRGVPAFLEEDFGYIKHHSFRCWKNNYSDIEFRHIEFGQRLSFIWEVDLEHEERCKWFQEYVSRNLHLETLRFCGFCPAILEAQLIPYFLPKYTKQLKSLTLVLPFGRECKPPEKVPEPDNSPLELEKFVVQVHKNWRPNWEFLNRCPKLNCFKLIGMDFIYGGKYKPVKPATFRLILQDVLPFLKSKHIRKLGLKFTPEHDLDSIVDFIRQIASNGFLSDLSIEVAAHPFNSVHLIRKLPVPSHYAKIVFTEVKNRYFGDPQDKYRFVNQIFDAVERRGFLKLPRLDLRITDRFKEQGAVPDKISLLVLKGTVVVRMKHLEPVFGIPNVYQARLKAWFPDVNYVCMPWQGMPDKTGYLTTKLLEAILPIGQAFELPGIAGRRSKEATKGLPLPAWGFRPGSFVKDATLVRQTTVHVPRALRPKDLSKKQGQVYVFAEVDPQIFFEVKEDQREEIEFTDISHWEIPGNLGMLRTSRTFQGRSICSL